MNALIIDDDVFLRKALGFILLDLDHTVAIANDATEAFELIDGNREYDLIFCDAMMPALTGAEFPGLLKKLFPEQQPIILMISSAKDGEELLQGMNTTYNYFVKKPIDMDKLRQLIGHIQKIKNKSITLPEK